MSRRTSPSLLPVLTALLAAYGMAPTVGHPAAAQDVAEASERFRVLVPDFEALEGADRRFGRDVAVELRALLNTLLTHQAIDRRSLRQALDRLDLDMDELDCVRTRQAAAALDAQLALCASYRSDGEGYRVTAVFWDTGAAESFSVGAFTALPEEASAVARDIFEAFDSFTQHLRAAANCEDYARSRLWQEALRNCDRALELNPDALGARYRRARTLFEMERGGEAVQELLRLLERDPAHEAALELAGYVSASLGRQDDARAFYARFLELQPENAAVRMRVAYDLAQAGDTRGALLLIREGLALDSANIDLWEQLGGYAFSVGETLHRERPPAGGDGRVDAPDAVAHFTMAIEAYERVFAARGAETPSMHLRNIVAARVRLGELEEALGTARQALETHPGDDGLWSTYADALRRSDRLPDALAALERVEAINPDYPNLGLRWGTWLMDARRPRDAVDVLTRLSSGDPTSADAAARIVVAGAYAEGMQKEDFAYVIEAMTAAKSLPHLSPAGGHQLNFWHGYALLQLAVDEQEPRTLETARGTLPKFREVLELLARVGDYPATVNLDIGELRGNVATFIEIQEAIIARGGR